jgi:hypothetical protein
VPESGYATPPAVRPQLADCTFYQTIELPEVGLCRGSWDLRPGIDRYLGSTDFAGKRVLELEAARVSNTVVLTETDWLHGQNDELRGMILFESEDPYTWYQVKPPLIETVLARVGFGPCAREDHTQRMVQHVQHTAESGPIGREYVVDVPHFTLTASRLRPLAVHG